MNSQNSQAKKVVEMKKDALVEAEKYIAKYQEIVSFSPEVISAITMIKTAISLGVNVLIQGATGVGKTVIAKLAALEQDKSMSFLAVNISAIPESLFESILFGHKKGSFTGAVDHQLGYFKRADKGVLFLDEIGDLPLGCQAKLLSAIEDGYITRVGDTREIKVKISFVFASNKNLSVLSGDVFRRDLYHRICGLSVQIPSLSERREEIELIANYFLRDLNHRSGNNKVLGMDVLNFLKAYDWPGNLRELKNEISSAFIKSGQSQKISSSDLSSRILVAPDRCNKKKQPGQIKLIDNEKCLIIKALEDNLWIQKFAARSLGITPRALNYRIQKFGITHPNWPSNKNTKKKKKKEEATIAKPKSEETKSSESEFEPEVADFIEVLRENGFNQRKTARELGVPRYVVRQAIKRNNIDIASLKGKKG